LQKNIEKLPRWTHFSSNNTSTESQYVQHIFIASLPFTSYRLPAEPFIRLIQRNFQKAQKAFCFALKTFKRKTFYFLENEREKKKLFVFFLKFKL